MNTSDLYQSALRAALLGTARAELPPELLEWAQQHQLRVGDASPEQLLQLASIIERLRRTTVPVSNPQAIVTSELSEEWPVADDRISRGLQLILDGLYPHALHECLQLLYQNELRPPDHQLPALLNRALETTDAGLLLQIIETAGPRGKWLATQNDEWEVLYPPQDPAALWKRLRTPADLSKLLKRWRQQDPAAALEALKSRWSDFNPTQQARLIPALVEGLSLADQEFLQAALQPRRKEVRREASRLLLRIREETILNHFSGLIASWLKMEDFRIELTPDGPTKDLLEPYGFYEARKSAGLVLLENLPPGLWQELTDLSPFDFVNRLAAGPSRANDYLPPLAKACITYGDFDTLEAIIFVLILFGHDREYWPKHMLQTFAALPQEQFEQLVERSMDRVERVARPNSLLHYIANAVPHSWPERLSRNLLLQLLDQLAISRQHYLPMQSAIWRPLAYRSPVALFEHFRLQLNAATERQDAGGKLATQILQIMSFRKTLRATFPAG